MEYKKLGANVRKYRKIAGLTQEELAEMVNTSRTTISMIETARQNPTILKVIDIARQLNTDINELIKDV